MKTWLTFLLFFATVSGYGQSISGFKLQDELGKSTYDLDNSKDKRAIVVVFFSNQCAYAKHYVGRIKSLDQKFGRQGVEVVLINSNADTYTPEESAEKMRQFAADNGLNLPYLSDKEKSVKTLFGAKRTPEVFVLKPLNNQFNIVYRGAIDDNPQVESDVNHHYLDDAVVSLLSGKSIELKSTRTVGCLIK